MRTLSANAQQKLAQNLGTSPVVIVEIQWTDGGSIYTYADRDIDNDEGKIIDVSELDNVITIQGVSSGVSGDSQQISITLDDADSSIKTIIDQNDVHKRPVWVYQWFENLDISDKFLLFKGQISSPIDWNEGDRTVSIDVLSRIEDNEVGFSIEEGSFQFADEDLIGKPWPLVFGTCINIPALRVRSPLKGTLKNGFGITDFTLAPRLEQLNKICCPFVYLGDEAVYAANPVTGIFGFKRVPIWGKDPDCECRRIAERLELEGNIASQNPFEPSTLEIIEGENFPQGERLTLSVNGAKVVGQFTGTPESPSTTFSVENLVHPEKNDLTIPPIINFQCPIIQNPVGNNSSTLPNQAVVKQFTEPECIIDDVEYDLNTGVGFPAVPDAIGPEDGDDAQKGWQYFGTFPRSSFFWAEPGTEVHFNDSDEIVYVANILPSTILRVAAYRTFPSGARLLSTVPDDFYTTRISDFNGYMVTEIVMTRPISRRGQGWEDEIFVSQTSTVGPNTVDIIEWLIDTYTSFSTDSTSFDSVKTSLENYPSHFPILDRRNILQVLQEIAFQARCAIFLRNDVFHLKYLPTLPSADDTITEDDVLHSTLGLKHTSTEELVTKLVATWQKDYALSDPNKMILRNNHNRYGTQQKEFSFYIYNIQELVTKSATFWLIRMSNTWRRMVCQTPLNKLALETLDAVDVTLPDIGDGTFTGVIERAQYNSEDHAVDLEVWTPLRSGSRVPFDFAYPSQIDVDLFFPNEEDFNNNIGGVTPNPNVSPPSTHVLAADSAQVVNFQVGESFCVPQTGNPFTQIPCRADQGERIPSDLNDTKPTVESPSGVTGTPAPTITDPAIGELTVNRRFNDLKNDQNEQFARMQQQIANATNASGGGAGQGASTSGTGEEEITDGDDLKDILDQLPDDPGDTCSFGLELEVADPVEAVAQDGGAIINTNPGESGDPFNPGSLPVETFFFGSEAARDDAQAQIQAIIDNNVGTVGEPFPFAANPFNPTPGCISPENTDSIVAYNGLASGRTVVGFQGFMTG